MTCIDTRKKGKNTAQKNASHAGNGVSRTKSKRQAQGEQTRKKRAADKKGKGMGGHQKSTKKSGNFKNTKQGTDRRGGVLGGVLEGPCWDISVNSECKVGPFMTAGNVRESCTLEVVGWNRKMSNGRW